MTDQQWQRAWEIYRAAKELPPNERRSYFASVSADPEVIEEITLLLEDQVPEAPPGTDLKNGTRVGRYELTGNLARGSMGQVYSALDTELGRQVALKFLASEVVATREAIDRLIREARAASALNHPHIVTVYEVVRSGDDVAIAMELVEGDALRTRCGKPQAITQVINWGRQIAQALAAAHQRSIVHRDIKPENVMVRSDGYVKVLDFGLARQIVLGSQSQSVNRSLGLAGTLNYMSPEQTRAEAATSASDVFSLGIVLYELVTGTHPFLLASPIDTAHAIASAEPKPPRDLQRDIPPTLNSLLLEMLAKDPAARPSAVQVARTLNERILENSDPRIPALTSSVPIPIRRRRSKQFFAALGAAVALLVVAIGFNLGGSRNAVIGTFHPRIRSIVVLPMENLSGDPGQEYFADGMTDQLITDLAQSTSLRVISRTSAMQYKHARTPLPAIARALDVDAVIEGSVDRRQGKVRIQAQLLDARADRHLWAQTYERDESNIWALQDEITREIADQVAAKLRPEKEADRSHNRPVNAVAYENYLRGNYYWAKRTSASLNKAAEYFQLAIDAEPRYALAYVGLANVYNVSSFYGGPLPSDSFPKAEVAARKALALDEDLGEAHAALADTLYSYHWDWAGAEREFQTAIRLEPGYATAHHWYGELLTILGRREESIAEIEQARELDPLSQPINQSLGGTFRAARRYDEAALQLRKTIELDPGFAPAHEELGWTYIEKGMPNEAISELERAVDLSGNSLNDVAALGWGFAKAGELAEARQIAAELEVRSREAYVSPEALAKLYVALGEKDLAIQRLEQAYRTHVDTLNQIKVEPCYDSLRSDARFQAIVALMNFPK
jgi:eukaryotic-like serine/threonine-protein kinase